MNLRKDGLLPVTKPESLRHHIENFLREAITSGRLAPGERLRERELCEQMEISRTSLREALRQLEAEKLITNKLHRGPTVAVMSRDDALDLYAVRAQLEGYAAHAFAQRASDEEIARLGQAVQHLHAAAASGDKKKLLSAKADFYEVILVGCGNKLVREMLLGMLSRINLLRSTSFSQSDRLRESLKEIDQLFALIKQRDAAGAQRIAQLHILNAQQAALAVLEEQQARQSNPLTPEEK